MKQRKMLIALFKEYTRGHSLPRASILRLFDDHSMSKQYLSHDYIRRVYSVDSTSIFFEIFIFLGYLYSD
jgi:hypothetical protein